MNSTKKVVLPIALVLGLVFGITFISNYTGSPEDTSKKAHKPLAKPTTAPTLIYGITNAEPNPASPILRNARWDWEVAAEGHYDFWFHNPNKEDVHVYLRGKSCTCAGAKLGVVPLDATKAAFDLACIGTLGAAPLTNLLMPLSTLTMTTQTKWIDLSLESEEDRKKIPAANDLVPSFGILKVTFSGKTASGESGKRVRADMVSYLPNSPQQMREFFVFSRTLPSISLYHRDIATSSVIDLGEIFPEQSATRDFYLFSSTRPELELRSEWMKLEDAHPCSTFTKPVALDGVEFDEISQTIQRETNFGPSRIRCMYKVTVTMRERILDSSDPKKIASQMELGPSDKTILFATGDGSENNSRRVVVRSIVRGEISVVGNNEKDRVDFGRSVNAETGAVREMDVITNRKGLDLELVPEATMPKFLDAKMTYKGEENGTKRWTLTVRIPPKSMNGPFPAGSAVILQVKDETKRRIRVPVIGSTIETRPF